MNTDHYTEIRRLLIQAIQLTGPGQLVTTGHFLIALLNSSTNILSGARMLFDFEVDVVHMTEKVNEALQEAERDHHLREVSGKSIIFSTSLEQIFAISEHFVSLYNKKHPGTPIGVNSATLVYGLAAERIGIAARILEDESIYCDRIETYITKTN